MSTTLPGGQVILTYDEAVSLLTVNEAEDGRRTIHTFLESPIALIGADWDEASVLALLREADARPDVTQRINATGAMASGMGHGVAALDAEGRMVFIAARPVRGGDGVTPAMATALSAIVAERERQEQRKAEGRFRFTCADPELSLTEKYAILGEEVAREVLTNEGRRLARDTVGTDQALYAELSQVAAVAVAWMESLLLDASDEGGQR